MKFKVGDIVKLETGGPEMVITGFGYSTLDKVSSQIDAFSPIYCEWYEGIIPRQKIVLEDDLEKIRPIEEGIIE